MGDRTGGVGNFARTRIEPPPFAFELWKVVQVLMLIMPRDMSTIMSTSRGNKNYRTRISQICAMSGVGEGCLDGDPFTNSFNDGGR